MYIDMSDFEAQVPNQNNQINESPPSSFSPSFEESELEEEEDLQELPSSEAGSTTVLPWKKRKRSLSKQLSMCETPGDVAWERRRRQIKRLERRRNSIHNCDDLTDEDLNELKGCIELGFGFNEEDGQTLCNTLPALDLYFAVNRQLSTSPASTPHGGGGGGGGHGSSFCGRSSSFGSPISGDYDSWKICSPGDDPEHIKTKLRHWAQAVACSVMQSH